MNLPTIPPELVAALDKLIPARCPGLAEGEREIWHYAGKRALVELLQQHVSLQQQDLTRRA
jgi:hypothetical protein